MVQPETKSVKEGWPMAGPLSPLKIALAPKSDSPRPIAPLPATRQRLSGIESVGPSNRMWREVWLRHG